jgi:SagB-type dehydrogenase family enzyme
MTSLRAHRQFLKSGFAHLAEGEEGVTDQRRGEPMPPEQKPCPPGAEVMSLPPPDRVRPSSPDLRDCLARRRSRRSFARAPLSPDELSFLLWATQGLREKGEACFRTAPSAGARHPFETYVAVRRVEGLAEGVYRYLPLGHELARLFEVPALGQALTEAALGQAFVGRAAAVFLWSCIPYRGEWRYGREAHKAALLDAGHVCQNLYLACEALGCGTCAIGAYDQERMDALLRLDGEDEFVVYCAPVGKEA